MRDARLPDCGVCQTGQTAHFARLVDAHYPPDCGICQTGQTARVARLKESRIIRIWFVSNSCLSAAKAQSCHQGGREVVGLGGELGFDHCGFGWDKW